MNRLWLIGIAVVLALTLGCESELQRKYREGRELQRRIDDEFEADFNKVKRFIASADANDGKSILEVIGELEELQQSITGVDQNLQTEFKKTIRKWNNNYLRLAQSEYKKVKSAAKKKLDIQDYKGAIAEMDKFPKVLAERGFVGGKIERYKKYIEAYESAPQAAHDTVAETREYVNAKNYDRAIERCEQFFNNRDNLKNKAAVRIVINAHISVLEVILRELVKKGEYDTALEKIKEWSRFRSEAHTEFLGEKRNEIEQKKAAGK